ncbi:MAG: TldD/PmbA family protein, partial [Calditrichaeota bacterium]
MKMELSRRAFLERGGAGIAAVTLGPHLFGRNFDSALAAPAPETMNLSDYLDHFNVTEKMIREILAEGLALGGDYCDVYFQHAVSHTIGLEDKQVNRAYSNVDLGVGIRVLKGDQTGYSFTEELTPASMKLAARTAANIASSGNKTEPIGLAHHSLPNYYPINVPWEAVKIDQKIPYLQTINDKVFAADPRIVKSRIYFGDSTAYILFASSEGRIVCDYQPMVRINVNVTAEENGRREQNGFGLASRRGLELLSPANVDRLADESVRRTLELFKAVKPEGGEMPVVLAAGGSGILLHEAIGHGMEADFNRKGQSIFSDKIDKPVAQNIVTIVDDGTNPNFRGSINVDDEGNDTQKTLLVENGILRSYLHDRISAQFYNVKPTGNGRRQSFRFSPLPRMRNTYMLNGPHTKEEIFASVKKGLYAEYFTNGEVRIGPGDFTFYVKSGYLIEDGKITQPVKDVNIIGNGPQVLADITMVADDFK